MISCTVFSYVSPVTKTLSASATVPAATVGGVVTGTLEGGVGDVSIFVSSVVVSFGTGVAATTGFGSLDGGGATAAAGSLSGAAVAAGGCTFGWNRNHKFIIKKLFLSVIKWLIVIRCSS